MNVTYEYDMRDERWVTTVEPLGGGGGSRSRLVTGFFISRMKWAACSALMSVPQEPTT
jgi:hypothetical protein